MSSYGLSVLSGTDSSSYFLVNEDGQVVAIRAIDHAAENLRWWREEEPFLASPVAHAQIGYLDPRFTISPSRLYNSEHRRQYLEALTDLSPTITVMADPIPELDVFLVYAMEQARLAAFRQAFVGSRQVHLLHPLLRSFARHNRQRGLPALYAYFWRNEVYLVGLEGAKLRFCNGFSFLDAKDALYFVLLAFEQCGWNPQDTPLHLCGEIVQGGEIFRWLQRYVRRKHFLSLPGDLRWGAGASAEPGHRFYDLAALYQLHVH